MLAKTKSYICEKKVSSRTAANSSILKFFTIFQVSTLRFALRIMCVPVEPSLNEHFDPWLLVRELDSEIKRLKQVSFCQKPSSTIVVYTPLWYQLCFIEPAG